MAVCPDGNSKTPNLEHAVEEQHTAYDVDKVIDKINIIVKHHTATKSCFGI